MAAAKSKSNDTDDVTDQISALQSELAELTKLVKDIGATKVQDVADSAADLAAQAAKTGEKYAARAEDGLDQALELVRDKPANALAVAMGVGFLIGLITGRK